MNRINYIFRINYILLFCLLGLKMTSQVEPTLFRKANKAKMNHWVDSIYRTMTEDERIGQLFMVIAEPKSDAANIQKIEGYITNQKVGGVLFHKGNPLTQAEVTNQLQKISRVPLFIALDGEWGLSMRLSETTRFPKNMMLGAIEDLRLIEAYGAEVGRQCREMGIHINFAPTIDVNSNTDNPVIGLRSFGEAPDAVSEKGVAYARGLESTGIFSVAKHFPGHGDTSNDSHHTLPVLRRSIKEMDRIELSPFRHYIQAGFAGIMTAHLYVPALDKRERRAASMSDAIVTDLLQKKDGFQGLCFTDALAMKGAEHNKQESPSVLALKAGNDIALAPNKLAKEIEAVKAAIIDGTLCKEVIASKCKKVLSYKYIAGLSHDRPIKIEGLSERLNSTHATWLAARLNEEAITLLKNESDYLPLKQLEKKKIALLSIGDTYDEEFQSTLGKYDTIDHYRITLSTKEAEIETIVRDLEKYDVIICGVYTVRINEHPALAKLAARKDWIYVFFTLPYFCKEYKVSIKHAKAVVMAYEGTPFAQEYAAQAIFGGIPTKGKLAVTIPGLFYAGTGIFTEKTRLGYHLPEEVGMDAARLAEIDDIVKEGLRKEAYPGCQVLVAKNGTIIYDKSFGYYDYQRKQKVTSHSVYDLASVSKATGTLLAVMKTYDDRLITLNGLVSSYIPSLRETNKVHLTIEELLYHQSGIVPSIPFYMKAIDEKSYTGKLYSRTQSVTHPVRIDAHTYARNDFKFLPHLVSKTKKPGFTAEIAKHLYVHDSFKDIIMQEIKESKLGERGKYRYSCVNFILLKMVVEQQTGQPMDKLLQTHFFDRLGACTTTYNPLHKMDTMVIVPTENDEFIRRQLLRGYVHDEAAAFQGGVSGNAGLFSNAGDLAKLLQLYLNGGTYGGESYLSTETCKLFTQSKSPTCRRGLGFDKPDTGNPEASPCGTSAPASVYGHTGYTGTAFWVDPDNQLIYIFLSNRVHPTRSNGKLSSLEIRTRIQDAIYRAIKK